MLDGNLETYIEDEVIVMEGSVNTTMFFVVSGAVALYCNFEKEDEIALGICGEGKIFNDLGMLNGTASVYTAVAFKKSKILKITRENFIDFVKEYPEKVIDVLRNMDRVNAMLAKNIEMLNEELCEKKAGQKFNLDKWNKDLKENIARYAVRANKNQIYDQNHFWWNA